MNNFSEEVAGGKQIVTPFHMANITPQSDVSAAGGQQIVIVVGRNDSMKMMIDRR